MINYEIMERVYHKIIHSGHRLAPIEWGRYIAKEEIEEYTQSLYNAGVINDEECKEYIKYLCQIYWVKD